MSFKIANFGKSDVPFLTCSIRVDWLSIGPEAVGETSEPQDWGADGSTVSKVLCLRGYED